MRRRKPNKWSDVWAINKKGPWSRCARHVQWHCCESAVSWYALL